MIRFLRRGIIQIVCILFLISCNSAKDLTVIDKMNAKVTVFEDYNLFETEHLSVRLPKTWKTYIEPNAKEQIRHSPVDKKGRIDQSQYLWLAWFKSLDPDKFIARLASNEERGFNRPGYKKSQTMLEKYEGSLGKGIQTELTFLSNSNKDDFKIRHIYLRLDDAIVEIRMVYKENGPVFSEIKKAVESVVIREKAIQSPES